MFKSILKKFRIVFFQRKKTWPFEPSVIHRFCILYYCILYSILYIILYIINILQRIIQCIYKLYVCRQHRKVYYARTTTLNISSLSELCVLMVEYIYYILYKIELIA